MDLTQLPPHPHALFIHAHTLFPPMDPKKGDYSNDLKNFLALWIPNTHNQKYLALIITPFNALIDKFKPIYAAIMFCTCFSKILP